MKVKAINEFYDEEEKKIRKIGDNFEVKKERYLDIKRFVREIKETKKK